MELKTKKTYYRAPYIIPHSPKIPNNFLDIKFPELVPFFNVEKNLKNHVYIRTSSINGHEIKIWFKCPRCGTEYYKTMVAFVKSKKRCKHCDKLKKDKEKTTKSTYITFRPKPFLSKKFVMVEKFKKTTYFRKSKPFVMIEKTNYGKRNFKRSGLFVMIEKSPKSYKKKKFVMIEKITEKSLNLLNINIKKRNNTKEKKENSLKLKLELLKDFNKEKNLKINFDTLNVNNDIEKLIWTCSNCKHEWIASISARCSRKQYKHGIICPHCNSFAYKQPIRLLEWDYDKNTINPYTISPYDIKNFYWICSNCEKSYNGKITDKCDSCFEKNFKTGSSTPEMDLLYICSLIFGFKNIIWSFKLSYGRSEIDIFIQKHKLGIEYDGVRFHSSEKNIKRDLIKNEYCVTKKYTLIRIRESGLEKISDLDIIFKNYKNDLTIAVSNLIEILKERFKLSIQELEQIKLVENMDLRHIQIPANFFINISKNILEKNIFNP